MSLFHVAQQVKVGARKLSDVPAGQRKHVQRLVDAYPIEALAGFAPKPKGKREPAPVRQADKGPNRFTRSA